MTNRERQVVRFWFRPRESTAQTLATKVMAAGHRDVVVRDGLVGLVPFELPNNAWAWVERMQNHFQADFVESA